MEIWKLKKMRLNKYLAHAGIASRRACDELIRQKKVKIKFRPLKGADHFYENYSVEFTSIVDNYIKDNLQSN